MDEDLPILRSYDPARELFDDLYAPIIDTELKSEVEEVHGELAEDKKRSAELIEWALEALV